MKKLVTLFLLILLLGCCALSAEATSGTCGDNVTWTYSDHTLTISGSGAMKDYMFSDAQPWSDYKEEIYHIIVNNGVTRIGDHAFSVMAVYDVRMADSVKSIGDYAFSCTPKLYNITIGKGVTTLESNVFDEASPLASIGIPKSVKKIGKNCFTNANWELNNTGLATVYYEGSGLDWQNIDIASGNGALDYATLYTNWHLVSRLELSDSKLTVVIGDSPTVITAQGLDGIGVNSLFVDWESSNPSVASVEYGAITGHAVGYSYIYATYQGYQATCWVTVNEKGSISIRPADESATVSIGESLGIYVTNDKGSSLSSNISWYSSNPSVATVGNTPTGGGVTGVSVGTVTITAVYDGPGTPKEYYGASASITITVVPRREGAVYYEGTTIIGCAYPSGFIQIPNYVGGNPVTAIAPYAFKGVSELTEITIPATVKSIGAGAFSGTSLGTVSFLGSSYQWVDINIAFNNSELENAYKFYSNSIRLDGIYSVRYDWNSVNLHIYHQELDTPVGINVYLQLVDEEQNAIAAYADYVMLSADSTSTYFQMECYPTDGSLMMKAKIYDANGILLGEVENIDYWMERISLWIQDVRICATSKNTAEFYSNGYNDWENNVYAIPDYVSGEEGDFTITGIRNSVSFDDGEILVIPKTIQTIGKNLIAQDSDVRAIGYMGTQEQWDAINIIEPNDWLNSLPITYNYKGANVMCPEFYIYPQHADEVIGAVFKVKKAYKACTAVVEIWNQQKTVLEKVKYIPIEPGIDKEYQIIEAFAGDDEQHRMVVRFEQDGVECCPSRLNYNFYAERPIYEQDGFLYKVYDDYAGIVGYIGEALDVVIPETLDGYSVKLIEMGAFYGVSAESITIPATVTEIGFDAFSFCEKLTQLIVAEDNQNYCAVDGVLFTKDKKILQCYPCGKTGTSYTVPYGTERIFGGAFATCNLEEIILPDTLTYIGEVAFYDTKITSITIPKSVQMIDGMALADCYSLTEIIVDEENEIYCDIDGVLFSKDKTALLQYPTGKKVHTYRIPDGVTRLGYSSMYGADIKAVYVPKTVTAMDGMVFSERTSCILCEGSEEEFSHFLMDGNNGGTQAEKMYSFRMDEDARLQSVDSRYCDKTMTVQAEFLYQTVEGTAVVAVYDTFGKITGVQIVPVGIDTGLVRCKFPANEDWLDYTVKVMYWNGTDDLMPYTESMDCNVKKSVVIKEPYETDHPYQNGKYYEYFYQYEDDCESIDLTFAEETSVVQHMDMITIEGNGFWMNYTGDELSGATIRIPGNFVRVSFSPWNPDSTGYGFKIEKTMINLF